MDNMAHRVESADAMAGSMKGVGGGAMMGGG
jgi:hypothetical protein